MVGRIEESTKGLQRGYTLVELAVVSAILVILAMIGLPYFTGMLRNSRLDAAARQVASNIREARSFATKTGWQYQIVGYNVGGSSAYKNQYRLAGRVTSTTAWPTSDVNPNAFQSATQMAGQWVNFNQLYQTISLNPANSTLSFYVSFNSQGVAFENNFPLTITLQSGGSRQVTVSSVGSVKIQ